MQDAWVNVEELKRRLIGFFDLERRDLIRFGSTVNQTFEAFVFVQVVSWYRSRPNEWKVEIKNPSDDDDLEEPFRLKFSTRGRPANYSYALCTAIDGSESVQVRHQLRIATRHHKDGQWPGANMCLDVAVIRNLALKGYGTSDHVANNQLLTFGEAKHMSAFAELVAGFIGMVHELQPERLRRVRLRKGPTPRHPPPFLFVSGRLWQTAEGIVGTIARRRYDLDVFYRTRALSDSLELPADGPAAPVLSDFKAKAGAP